MLFDDTVILLFAKAPVEGKVNTRLIDDIGVKAATKLQHELIHQRLSMLEQANLCSVNLMCVPDIQHECFLQCEKIYSVSLNKQLGKNIGYRMLNGVRQALQNYKYCIVIGSDAPALDEEKIKQAIEVLHAETDVVFVPAEDGGYVLVGLQQAYEFLFQQINWGSGEVMQQTRNKLKENNVSFKELEICWDIDRVEDYERYRAFIKK